MLSNALRFIKQNWILLLILAAGLFLRVYKPLELFMYSHDQDLLGWFIKDVVVNHHFRFIGQETSSLGIFIGPLYYYLQIPFYFLTRMDPAGGLILPVITGVFAIFSNYFVFSKIFNKRVGLIAAAVYALSYVIIFTDKEVVPTTPAMLWTIWFFYFLWNLFKGKSWSYIFLGLLLGLAWNFNLALIILTPLILIVQIFSKKKWDFKFISIGILVFLFVMTPFFLFETRHGFNQTKSIISSLTTSKDQIPGMGTGYAKFDRVLQLVHTNTTSIFWNPNIGIRPGIIFYLLIVSFGLLVYKKKIPGILAVTMFLWQVLYILFFTFNSLNPSEYYLNGMNVVWIAVFAVGVDYLLSRKDLKFFGYLVLAVFVYMNLFRFFTKDINRSGYIERKALVAYIAADSRAHGYPCVSVSYITSPGNDLGYRYFFWLAKLHVNQSKSGSPVYSIVYPTRFVSRVDRNFGVLGLILPDYGKYTEKAVNYSCSGANSNLTDPLFGYTE